MLRAYVVDERVSFVCFPLFCILNFTAIEQIDRFIDEHLLPQINQHNPHNIERFPVADMLMVLRAIEARANQLAGVFDMFYNVIKFGI